MGINAMHDPNSQTSKHEFLTSLEKFKNYQQYVNTLKDDYPPKRKDTFDEKDQILVKEPQSIKDLIIIPEAYNFRP